MVLATLVEAAHGDKIHIARRSFQGITGLLGAVLGWYWGEDIAPATALAGLFLGCLVATYASNFLGLKSREI